MWSSGRFNKNHNFSVGRSLKTWVSCKDRNVIEHYHDLYLWRSYRYYSYYSTLLPTFIIERNAKLLLLRVNWIVELFQQFVHTYFFHSFPIYFSFCHRSYRIIRGSRWVVWLWFYIKWTVKISLLCRHLNRNIMEMTGPEVKISGEYNSSERNWDVPRARGKTVTGVF